MAAALLRIEDIEKSFAGVRALKPVSLEIDSSEIVGIVGENGAGKSTLIKILSGVYPPDRGRLIWQNEPARFASPRGALERGIATIHQELAYFGHLSVTENLMMGERWPRFGWGGVDWGALHSEAGDRLSQFDLFIAPERFFNQLSPAQKQEVAIVRALSHRARLLILDEPTASLSEPEVRRLFVKLRKLRSEGVAIIYVSHRLDEVLSLTDRILVLRDGELAAEYPTAQATVNRLVKDMVGRPLEQVYPHTRGSGAGPVLLEVEGLGREGMFHNVTFQVRAGEILGLAGLVGAGRSDVARAIYGLYPVGQGTIKLRGQKWTAANPGKAVQAGLVYLPEERKRQSLVPHHSVKESISIGFTDLLAKWGIIRKGEEAARVEHAMKTFDVRAASSAQEIRTLSGGNQQKAMLARWLERGPEIILLDEPTRGVDVGAKAEIHGLIDQLAVEGKAVLLISSDLPEVLGMSDRVLVMHQGTIAAELIDEAMTQENVIRAASGLSRRGEGGL